MLKSEPMQRCCLDECRAACCLHGVWVDKLEAEQILSQADRIAPFMAEGHEDQELWFDGSQDSDEDMPSGQVVHSTVVDDPEHYGGTACIFLRSDHKCALQVAGEANGYHPWHFKPFYCVLHPLDLDDEGRITLDETGPLLAEQASCLRPAAQKIPLLETFQPELTYLLGEKYYRRLVDRVETDPPSTA